MPELGDTVSEPRKRLRYVLDLPPTKTSDTPQYAGEATAVSVLRSGTIVLKDAEHGKCDFFANGRWDHCATEVIDDA